MAATVAVLAIAGSARAEELRSVPPPAGDVLMSRFYDAPTERVGTFPGRPTCLGCDSGKGHDTALQCEDEGERPALSIDGDSVAHPLLAGTMDVVQQLASCETNARDVAVHGKYYPTTGAILVDAITARD